MSENRKYAIWKSPNVVRGSRKWLIGEAEARNHWDPESSPAVLAMSGRQDEADWAECVDGSNPTPVRAHFSGQTPFSGPNLGTFSKLNGPGPVELEVTPIPIATIADTLVQWYRLGGDVRQSLKEFIQKAVNY